MSKPFFLYLPVCIEYSYATVLGDTASLVNFAWHRTPPRLALSKVNEERGNKSHNQAPLPHRTSVAEGYTSPSCNTPSQPTNTNNTPGTNFNSTTPCLVLPQILCGRISRIASRGPEIACPVPYFLTGHTQRAFLSLRPCCIATSEPRTGSGRRTFQTESPLPSLSPQYSPCRIPLPSLLPQDPLLLHPFNSKHRPQYFSPHLPPDTYGRHRPRDPRVT